jgi:hypothetical protein
MNLDTAGLREFDCVPQQVDQHLAKPARIAADFFGHLRRNLAGKH